ncbi:MAG TPA: ArsC/Spx/MgsR family protein [Gemmatimonadaceae bacterium]|nr:ArsC/Spx/MgsR family protein [Gemmatimonadaceae bacterium]
MEVQIFGVKKSADTRKALRFFAERRIKTHFVDFDERTVALGELKRFVQKFGLDALLDRDGKVYAEAGLRYASYTEQRMFEKVMDEPRLLRMPLVRQIAGSGLTVGLAESEWKDWIAK